MDDYNNLMVIFAFTAIIFSLFVYFMAGRIETAKMKLTPSMYDPKGRLQDWDIKFVLCFNNQFANEDNFETYDNPAKLPRLAYLKEELGESEDPFLMLNSHESLFCCGRFGVNCLILNVFQWLLVFLMALLAININKVPDQVAFI